MKKKIGKIFISGGGGIEESFLLDKQFVRSLTKRKVLYIPLALNRDNIGFEACYDWIISALARHSDDFINITMLLDLAGYKKELNDDFDGIYIGGGNTYKLLQHIYNTGFDKKLTSFLRNGGLVYGGSAGAIILGKSIAIVSEENDNDYKYNKGLSLIGNYSIMCHYNEAEDDKILEFVKLYQSPVIALPEGSGLIIDKEKCEVVGDKSVLIFGLYQERKSEKSGNFINYISLTI